MNEQELSKEENVETQPIQKNTPYVKEYNEFGQVTNPITEHNPYPSGISTRQLRRGNETVVIDSVTNSPKIVRRVKSAKRKRDWV